eukprot:COSAG02_NODE_15364_length_1177_cov_25.512059_1_plen_63_part_00
MTPDERSHRIELLQSFTAITQEIALNPWLARQPWTDGSHQLSTDVPRRLGYGMLILDLWIDR